MEKRIFTEDLFPEKQEDDVVELMIEKRKKMYLNISLLLIYTALLVTSLFII